MTLKTFDKARLVEADAIVLVGLRQFKTDDLNWIIKNCKNIVKAEMDYGFCEFGNCKCFSSDELINNCGRCTPDNELIELYNQLFDKCKYFVFFTPAQREHFRKFFGNKVDNSILYVQFYDDLAKYYDMNLTRIPNSYLWCGRISVSKGWTETLMKASQHPDKRFFFIGKPHNPGDLAQVKTLIENQRNCCYLGSYPHDQMYLFYNLMENFVYDGQWPDTGPATVIEAKLCGCTVYASPHTATILSNNFISDQDIRDRITQSKELFWTKLETVRYTETKDLYNKTTII